MTSALRIDIYLLIRLMTRQRFIDRIGKRMYRDSLGEHEKDCKDCKQVAEEGLVVLNESHADYLHTCNKEMGINYYDSSDPSVEKLKKTF